MGDTTDTDDQRRTELAERRRWRTDTTADYAVGPDDAGNIVMHGISLVVAGWRALVAKVSRRP